MLEPSVSADEAIFDLIEPKTQKTKLKPTQPVDAQNLSALLKQLRAADAFSARGQIIAAWIIALKGRVIVANSGDLQALANYAGLSIDATYNHVTQISKHPVTGKFLHYKGNKA